MPSMNTPPNRTASLVFACLALPFGLAMGAVTPPMQVADEGQHFFRAYQVSQGVVLPTKRRNVEVEHKVVDITGGDLPMGISGLYQGYEPLIQNPHFRISDPKKTLEFARRFKIEPKEHSFRWFNNTAVYSPLGYIPQALGIAAARLFSNSALTCFYAARLANLLASVACIFLAIRITSVFPWVFAFLALSPMAIYEMASVSSDASIIGICFLFIAVILRCAFGPDSTISRGQWLALFLLAAAIGLVKQMYLPLALLYLLIPVAKVGSRSRYWTTLAGICMTMVFTAGIWGLATRDLYAPVVMDADPQTQIEFVKHHPGTFAYALVRNLTERQFLFRYVAQYIGWFGHLDQDSQLPGWFVCVHALMLLLVASFDASPKVERIDWRSKLLCLGICLLCYTLVSAVGYVAWMPVGADWVIIQGRYLLPIGPVLFLCLYNLWRRFPEAVVRMSRALPWCAWIYVPLSLCFVTWMLYERFYVLRAS